MNALLLTNRNVITQTKVGLNRNFSNGRLSSPQKRSDFFMKR